MCQSAENLRKFSNINEIDVKADLEKKLVYINFVSFQNTYKINIRL
jgi:hypothetical protein